MKKTLILTTFILFSFTAMIFSPIENKRSQTDNLDTDQDQIYLNIVVPAYNEEARIGEMLTAYNEYFKNYRVHFTIVLNGITDNTESVVQSIQNLYPDRISILTSEKGKGNAIIAGFLHALTGPYTHIGFVDADMATTPDQYEMLLGQLLETPDCDGVIASRYMEGSDIGTPRPFIKKWGRELFYNRRIKKNLDLHYHDYQCGAKIFTRALIASIAPLLTESHWTIDLDILYLAQQHQFNVKEIPIKWRDAPGSHLNIFSSLKDFYKAVDRIKHKSIKDDPCLAEPAQIC